MKNTLLFFPVRSNFNSGYSILVKNDIERLNMSKKCNILYATKQNIFTKLKNLFLFYPSVFEFKELPSFESYNRFFIGDIVLSKPIISHIKKTSKDNSEIHVTLRVHNLYLRYLSDNRIYKAVIRDGLFFYCKACLIALNEIRGLKYHFNKIEVVSIEDKVFLEKKYLLENVEIVSFHNQYINLSKKIKANPYRIIWFGGISSHKVAGLKLFIKEIMPRLLILDSRYEMHIFGSNTEKLLYLEDEKIQIHGFYDSHNLPFNGEGIFINPDLSGIGIKIKLLKLMQTGAFFISTPEGFHGYEENANGNYVVANFEKWFDIISSLRYIQE